MHERIKELAEQAYVTTLTTKGHEFIVDGCYIVSPDKLEKFAELIVRECAKSANDWYQNHDKIHSDPMSYVLSHFGVEE
jgi:hypothetical protein